MRDLRIDAIKGIAIIGVIIAHMTFESRFEPLTILIIDHLQKIFGWCVIAFFFTSGLLFKDINNRNRKWFFNFIYNRFKRLIIPCFVFSITYKVILYFLFLSGRFSWSSPIPNSINETLLFFFQPIGPQFYFLVYLFVISVTMALFQCFVSNDNIFIISLLFLVLSFAIEPPNVGYGEALTLVPLYIYCYISGVLLSSNSFKSSYYIKISLAPLLLSIYINNYIACYILAPITLSYLFFRYSEILILLPIIKIGKYSAGIYVWHAPIILPFVSIVFVKLFGGGALVILPIIVSTIFLSFFLSFITFKTRYLRLLHF